MPDPHDELVAYQTLFSLWPAAPTRTGLPNSELERVREYALKAARETKRRTSWTDPDAGYERRLTAAITRISRDGRFRQEMSRFLGAVGAAAATNAMALLVLKTCVPGVPDFYQGTETFEPVLTDPDNRRAVDFAARSDLLESLPDPDLQPPDLAPELRRLLAHWQSGAMKLYLMRALLHLRRELPALFATAPYVPLEVNGPRSAHIVTLARHNRRDWVVAVLPRHSFSIAGRARFPTGGRVWSRETVLLPKAAPSTFIDIFTGAPIVATKQRLALGPVLGTLPVSVLRSTR
jgi:(1->4)-alpha-D-glucan 1-alpha-D-glucosylmutase